MNQLEKSGLAIAEMAQDSAAMVDAALAGDFDEARFRAQLIVAKADAAGLLNLTLAAAYICDRLGPIDSVPKDGYGAGMLRVADELDRIGFKPI
ncbi:MULTISPECIES: hypothetical protein [Luteibacter]|uniref:hypothetical protein n=1 Tax=Luteibacter TaxID=242605 RepID=UPI00056D0E8D|nr:MULTISPECIES: hypothetical protein [unclassified Luteibacter]